MSAIRRAASRILRFVVRNSPTETRSWGDAMLREMDFVDGDWDALRWALGSTTAICRQSLLQRWRDVRERAGRDASLPRKFARVITSILPGLAVALAVWIVCVMALSGVERASRLEPSEVKLAERLFVIAIPEALFLLGAVTLWRRQRRAATGILAAGAILITHGIVHFVTHG